MKILVFDYLFVKGHIHPNTHYIYLLAKNYDITVVSIDGFFTELSSNINVRKVNAPFTIKELRASRLNQIKLCKLIRDQINLSEYDIILLFSYEIASFCIGRLYFPKKSLIVLQDHNTIDKLKQNRLLRLISEIYKNKVEHIVYEDFMKDALVNNYGVCENKVHVLPRAKFAYKTCETDKAYSAIGLSGSNSDEYIQELILQGESHREMFEDIKIMLKSHKQFEVKSSIVNVLNERVSDDEYQEFFNSTRVVLDPLPASFEYRMSAVLFEALSSRKIVIGSDTKIVRAFANKYPHICLVAENPLEMLKLVKNVSKEETEDEKRDFNRFNADYCDEQTLIAFDEIFKLAK